MSIPSQFIELVCNHWNGSEPTGVLPANQNQILVGRVATQDAVFRITPDRHRTGRLIQNELDWMSHLREHGIHAPEVIASKYDRQFETVEMGGETVHVVAFERVPGKPLAQSGELSEPLAERWGRLLGQMNRITAGFHPDAPFRWAGDTTGVTALAPCRNALPNDLSESVVAAFDAIGRMERTAPQYGLIHGDFNDGNIHLAGDTLYPLDFDECCYQWRLFDVAQALYCLYFDFARGGRDLRVLSRLGEAFLSGFGAEFPMIDSTITDLQTFLTYRMALVVAWTHGLEPAPRWMASSDEAWKQHLRVWSREEIKSGRIVDVFCRRPR